MSELEHNGWMAQRQAMGWRKAAERDDYRKHHPSMLPYSDLPEQEKNKDRDTVQEYETLLKSAGYVIVKP